MRFENCKFVWNDSNGSSFVQNEANSQGTYTFENCEFEFNEWWQGDLIRNENTNANISINLNNITVKGTGTEKLKVVGGYIRNNPEASKLANNLINYTCKGANKYIFDGTELEWKQYVFGRK